MNKNIIYIIICLAILPTIIALPSGTVYKNEPVLLATGFNGVGIIPNYSTLIQGDFNISLVNNSAVGESNLLGMSFMTPNGKCIDLTSLTFWDSSDNSLNYEDAKTNNWIDAIEFTENLETTGEVEEFTKLCPYEAIWIKSFLAINMTVSNVLGSPVGETYGVFDLRVSNGTSEKSYGDAVDAVWVEFPQFYDTGTNSFQVEFSSITAWTGYFFNNGLDKLYILTNNQTKKNVIKVKCNAKYVGGNKVCKIKPRAKYIGADKVFKWRWFSTHIIRLIGGKRKTIG